jgi:hypothetical protein
MSDVHGVIKSQWEASRRGVMTIWTVYERPTDYPDGFIARRFEVGGGKTTATDDTLVSNDLERLRQILARAGLIKLLRNERDEPQIVESWL